MANENVVRGARPVYQCSRGCRGLILLLGLLAALASSAAGEDAARAAGEAGARAEWIDVHVHLVCLRGDYSTAVKIAAAGMDDAGVRMSVVLPPPQIAGQARRPFDWQDFKGALWSCPGRFAFLGGGGTLNPMIHDAGNGADVDEQTRSRFAKTAEEILAAGAAGFGEIAAHHLSHAAGHPYESVPADNPLLLLLADIAARHEAVIDLHFDLVTEDLSLPARFTSPLNPPVLHANLAAFERLLAHNRKASIAWAHAGSDPLGNWTPALSRELLGKHPNLYMSVRIPPGPGPGGMRPPGPGPAGARPSLIISPNGEVNPEWLGLLKDFPDRFVIGSDQFMAPPELTGEGYGIQAAKKSALGAPAVRERTRKLLASLPADVARKIAYENAQHLYKLGP